MCVIVLVLSVQAEVDPGLIGVTSLPPTCSTCTGILCHMHIHTQLNPLMIVYNTEHFFVHSKVPHA